MGDSDSEQNEKTFNLFGDIFIYDKVKNKSNCLLPKNGKMCSSSLCGKKPSNLQRHVRLCHTDFVGNIIENRAEINIPLEALLNICVEMITVDGRPFSIFNDSGFKKIFDLLLQLIKQKEGKSYHINKPKIISHLQSIRDEIKNKIIEESRQKLISIQLDIATRNKRAILGINMQYFVDKKKAVRTLAMVPIQERHTGKNLAKLVKGSLAEFNISLLQVYSVTTDNGSNVLLSAEIMNELAEAIADDIEGDLTLGQVEVEFYQNLLKETEAEFFNDNVPHYIISLACGAHTFQLALEAAIVDSGNTAEVIEKCRTIMKKLRTPNILRAIKEKKLNFPLLDNDTRWTGKYSMVCLFIFKRN